MLPPTKLSDFKTKLLVMHFPQSNKSHVVSASHVMSAVNDNFVADNLLQLATG